VDNASGDGTVELVSRAHPSTVRVIALTRNEGFGAANNRAFAVAKGRYFILLNSDAFVQGDAIEAAIRHMDATPSAGAGGARLTHEDGSWQPSACAFPSPINDFLLLAGLANRHARFPSQPVVTDWVPGAFMILRPEALRAVGGGFDESFFLYYEEVDLCRRLRRAGYRVWSWPDIRVIHLGGESAKTNHDVTLLSSAGSQLTAWRYRSAWIYYRKHHGVAVAWLARQVEELWHLARALRNRWSRNPVRRSKAAESRRMVTAIRSSWNGVFGKRSAELTA
jgi:GT2 family glycosyltransferase